MTSQEKLNIMQAYLDGASVQFRFKCDNLAAWTNQIGEPDWNWCHKDYRITPKENIEAKYSIGDILVKKSDEGISYAYDLYRIDGITDEGYWFSVRNPSVNTKWIKCSLAVEIEEIETDYILMDDCFWYWENTSIDRYFKYSHRWTKKELKPRLPTNSIIVPLYALGFRLPKEDK